MNELSLAEMLGLLAAAWSVGFCAGFLMTRYREGINQVS